MFLIEVNKMYHVRAMLYHMITSYYIVRFLGLFKIIPQNAFIEGLKRVWCNIVCTKELTTTPLTTDYKKKQADGDDLGELMVMTQVS